MARFIRFFFVDSPEADQPKKAGSQRDKYAKRVSRRVFGARNYLFLSYTMVSSNDVQKLFLQAILSRKIVSQKLALKIWEKCVEAVTGS